MTDVSLIFSHLLTLFQPLFISSSQVTKLQRKRPIRFPVGIHNVSRLFIRSSKVAIVQRKRPTSLPVSTHNFFQASHGLRTSCAFAPIVFCEATTCDVAMFSEFVSTISSRSAVALWTRKIFYTALLEQFESKFECFPLASASSLELDVALSDSSSHVPGPDDDCQSSPILLSLFPVNQSIKPLQNSSVASPSQIDPLTTGFYTSFKQLAQSRSPTSAISPLKPRKSIQVDNTYWLRRLRKANLSTATLVVHEDFQETSPTITSVNSARTYLTAWNLLSFLTSAVTFSWE